MNENRLMSIIWVILVTLTLIGYWIGEQGMSGTVALAILLSAAFVKGQLVISHFMEMKEAPNSWKWIPSGWMVIVLAAIAVTY